MAPEPETRPPEAARNDGQSQNGSEAAVVPAHPHHWSLLPFLRDSGIISEEDGRAIVMGHHDAVRRALREIMMTVQEMAATEEITLEVANRIRGIVLRHQADSTPDT